MGIRLLFMLSFPNFLQALTAPGIVDNFYYNLLDWSRKNLISLGLNHEVYTKKAFSLETAELCPLVVQQGSEVSAIKWNEWVSYLYTIIKWEEVTFYLNIEVMHLTRVTFLPLAQVEAQFKSMTQPVSNQ